MFMFSYELIESALQFKDLTFISISGFYAYKNLHTKPQNGLNPRFYANMCNQEAENFNISPTQISEKRQFEIGFFLISNMYGTNDQFLIL